MRYRYAWLWSLVLLVGGCTGTKSTSLDFAQNDWYTSSAFTSSQCQTLMTVAGGLKMACAQ